MKPARKPSEGRRKRPHLRLMKPEPAGDGRQQGRSFVFSDSAMIAETAIALKPKTAQLVFEPDSEESERVCVCLWYEGPKAMALLSLAATDPETRCVLATDEREDATVREMTDAARRELLRFLAEGGL